MTSISVEENRDIGENRGGENPDSGKTKSEERIVFQNRMEYLAVIFLLQSGNYNFMLTATKCAKYDGITFLIIYFCIHHLVIAPLQCQSLFLGYYSKFGYMKIWNIFPIGYGIGASMMAFSLYTCINWSALTGQLVLHFFLALFIPENYWSSCNYEAKNLAPCFDAETAKSKNVDCNNSYYPGLAQYYRVSNFWRPDETPDGIGSLNSKWIAVSAIVWIIVCILTIRDFKFFKGMFAKFGYLITLSSFLTVVLNWANQGQSDKESHVLIDFTALFDYNIWVKALTHAILMSHICEGTFIQLGSYGPKSTMPDTDALLVGFLTTTLQYFSIVYVYATYRWMAGLYKIDMNCFVTTDSAVLLALTPTQLSFLPKAKIWILCSFLVLSIKGIMEMTIVFTSTINSFSETFPSTKGYRPYLVSVVTLSCFLMSLIFMTKAGEIFSDHSLELVGTLTVLLILAIMSSLILFSYSVSRLCDDIQFMHNFEPTLFMKAVFYLTPLFTTYYTISHLAVFLMFLQDIEFSVLKGLWELKPFLIVCCACLTLPLFIVALIMYGVHVRTHTVAMLFRPTKSWGYPDDEIKKLRSCFNPRRELRYMVNKPCAHICLLGDQRMKMEIKKREAIRKSLKQHGFGTLEK